ncbi:MAG: hypothetical protein HY984_01845 [Candidatus Magasanikbacteria bacterium]|nr:hypothetical protein [Candidatus Magasanikbacteria bacterium]
MNSKKLYLLGVVGGLVLAGLIIMVTQLTQPTKKTQNSPPVLRADSDAFASWVTVSPPNGLFSARFPAAPQTTNNTLAIPDSSDVVVQDTFNASDDKGSIYFVSTAIYPVPFDPSKNSEALQSALDGMVGALPGAKLVNSQAVDFKGVPSLEFMIQDASQAFHQGKLLIRDRTLYQVFVTYEEGALDENEYRNFLANFSALGGN